MSPIFCIAETDRRIKVIADDYVDREFGTGALKITPGHDPNDYEIGKRFGLEIINIMNNDGSLNANAARYEGMDRFDARQKLWADMEVRVDACVCACTRVHVWFTVVRGGEVHSTAALQVLAVCGRAS